MIDPKDFKKRQLNAEAVKDVRLRAEFEGIKARCEALEAAYEALVKSRQEYLKSLDSPQGNVTGDDNNATP